jgi:hypothetical protein
MYNIQVLFPVLRKLYLRSLMALPNTPAMVQVQLACGPHKDTP